MGHGKEIRVMKKLFTLLVAVAFIAVLPVRAEEPADGAKKESADKPKKLRLVRPWADLSTLNDEQRAKISEIHAEYVEKINQLREDEEAAIMALFTEDNKAELAKQEADRKQAQKERNAARRAAQKAGTTQPADKE
jgi:Spy/CpxP family protein refolding chaperone